MNELKQIGESRGGGRVSMLSVERRTELARFLSNALKAITEPKAKYARLQHAIRQAILSDVLQSGDQLPPEQEIADGTGLSLGTVRRCLSNMVREGVVSREHGRGTFVAGPTLTENEVWHCRYLEDDFETVRPIYQRVIYMGAVTETGPWSKVLGDSADGFIRIERAMNVDSLLICHSNFYLRTDRFREFTNMPTHEIESIGVKHLMAIHFHVSIVRVQKVLQTLPVPSEVASIIQVSADMPAHRLLVIGYDIHDNPVSYQVIWMPMSDIPLDLSPPTDLAS